LNLMWDESLPSYDGSLEHNIIVLSLYGRVIVYYIFLLLGLLTTLVFLLCPFIAAYLGYNSIKIKFKEDKKHKRLRKEKEKNEKTHQDIYLDRLDKNLKKKKKNKHS